MERKILIFTNGEKLGDGIIKIDLLHEIKKRLPNHRLIWLANGTTVYKDKLKLFSEKYIDMVIDNAQLNPFFWNKTTNIKYLLDNKFEYIFDTQKAVFRTIALKRLKHSIFISSSAKGIFSNQKLIKTKNEKKYYLEELIDLLDNIKNSKKDNKFKIFIPTIIENYLNKLFIKENKYIGIAPGAGEKDKIWPIDNFIYLANYFKKKSYKIVWFLGPDEQMIKKKIKDNFPDSLYPEELISQFSNYEIVMATTKYLSIAISNDSGISHILSTKLCPLIKLFGKKNSLKFTPKHLNITTISASEFNSDSITDIDKKFVIRKIDEILQ